jgi:hypothetical protein
VTAAGAVGSGAESVVYFLDVVLRAGLDAISTVAATLFIIKEIGLERLAFGIVAPPAGERAALEEDGSADAGAIIC